MLSIDKYDVLRYAETLGEEDLQLLLEQLILIRNVKYPVVYKDILGVPPLVPAPPNMIWKDCTCGSWWKVVHRKDCKCGGGRFVPEDEL